MILAILLSCASSILFSPYIILASPLPLPIAEPHPQADSRPPKSGIYPEPQPCSGNCTWIHDPSIIYEDGLYWRFSTSGNIAIATAPSLVGPWTYKGALLTNGTKISIREDQDIWVSGVFARMQIISKPFPLTLNLGAFNLQTGWYLLLPLFGLLHILSVF